MHFSIHFGRQQFHVTTISLLTILSASLASPAPIPQTSLNDLPVCAQQAGLAAIEATGCGFADLSCICESVPFLDTLRAYIVQNCSEADQAAALAFGKEICSTAGVTISAEVTSATLTPATTTAASPATTTIAVSGTATSTVIITSADTMMTTTTMMPSYSTTMMANGNRATSSPGLEPFTGGASSLLRTETLLAAAGAGGIGWVWLLLG